MDKSEFEQWMKRFAAAETMYEEYDGAAGLASTDYSSFVSQEKYDRAAAAARDAASLRAKCEGIWGDLQVPPEMSSYIQRLAAINREMSSLASEIALAIQARDMLEFYRLDVHYAHRAVNYNTTMRQVREANERLKEAVNASGNAPRTSGGGKQCASWSGKCPTAVC